MNQEGKIRVLVIDDSKVSRLILTQIFEKMCDLSLGTVLMGKQALMLYGTVPDVITLDLAMPKVDGFEFLDKMKGLEYTGDCCKLSKWC